MRTVKGLIYSLILITLTGSLGLNPLPQKDRESYLFSLKPLILGSRFLNGLVEQDCLTPDDGYNTNDDDTKTTLESLKDLSRLLSIAGVGLLTSWELLFDTVDSSPYFSFFASAPLRSPPLLFL